MAEQVFFEGGLDIVTAARRLVAHALASGTIVKGKFSEIELEARPETTPEEVVNDFWVKDGLRFEQRHAEDVFVSKAFLRRAQKWGHRDMAGGAGIDLGDYIQDDYLEAVANNQPEKAEKLARLMKWEEKGGRKVSYYSDENVWVKINSETQVYGVTIDEAISFIEQHP